MNNTKLKKITFLYKASERRKKKGERIHCSWNNRQCQERSKGITSEQLEQYDNRVDEGIGLVLDEYVVLAVFFSVVE